VVLDASAMGAQTAAAAVMELLDIQNGCLLAGWPPLWSCRYACGNGGWVKTETLAGLQPASFLTTT